MYRHAKAHGIVGKQYRKVVDYYLFLPTWFVSIILYTLMARSAGAADSYPKAEAAEREFQERVEALHAKQAETTNHAPVKDTSGLTKAIKAVWMVLGLAVPMVLALRVLFGSPDLASYEANRELFYDVTIWSTIIYFIFAYWELQRSKALFNKQSPKQAATAS